MYSLLVLRMCDKSASRWKLLTPAAVVGGCTVAGVCRGPVSFFFFLFFFSHICLWDGDLFSRFLVLAIVVPQLISSCCCVCCLGVVGAATHTTHRRELRLLR